MKTPVNPRVRQHQSLNPTGIDALKGLVLGSLLGVLFFAPAAWMGPVVERVSHNTLSLINAKGTFWSGSALIVVQERGRRARDTSGESEAQIGALGSATRSIQTSSQADSDSLARPVIGQSQRFIASELSWHLKWFSKESLNQQGDQTFNNEWSLVSLHIDQACCMDRPVVLEFKPTMIHWHQMAVQIRFDDSTIRIPANWLSALGAPWNTVAPKGLLNFKTQGLILTSALWGNLDQRMSGGAELTLENLSSQLSTLEPLGTYKIRIFNRAELRSPSATATNGMSGVAFGGASGGVFGSNNTNQAIALGVKLETIEGRLELSGDGLWSNNHFTFNGTAKAQTGFEAALANLLAVLGPRTDNMATLRIG